MKTNLEQIVIAARAMKISEKERDTDNFNVAKQHLFNFLDLYTSDCNK